MCRGRTAGATTDFSPAGNPATAFRQSAPRERRRYRTDTVRLRRNQAGSLNTGPQASDDFIVTEIPVNVGRVLRTERYKYVTYADDPIEQLYDMQSAPGETRNLPQSHGQALSTHKKLLREWESHLQTAPENLHTEWWRKV